MTQIEESTTIGGVYFARLRTFGDERGRFTETFRKEWFPQRSWNIVQMNRSDSQAGVLRGLHFHHKQVDYWYVLAGRIRAGLVDLRPHSPTYRATQTVEMGEENNVGLFIPLGVAHGFVALTAVTLTYIVDNYYDGNDEFGIAWNDPALNLDWQITTPPILSGRDAANPLLADIPPNSLPRA
ncbi:MAG: dTDP-4-dehydrorhamnose 3,5-epimerase family protein [Anaerolineales bacterium]|nr:dTDP-4-dehydrorhamnose 3,5-epimerase family protein [Anaerolineales bacterium]